MPEKKRKIDVRMDRKMTTTEEMAVFTTWHDEQLVSPSASSVEDQQENYTDKKLTVYVRARRSSWSCVWLVVNAHAAPSPTYVEDHAMSDYPAVLSALQGYANAVCGSKIYFLGGTFMFYEEEHDIYYESATLAATVYAFDTVTRAWFTDLDPMLSARVRQTAVAVREKIYLFGCGYGVRFKHLSRECWGECYDTQIGSSAYLSPPPQDLYDLSDGIRSHTVYKSEILFWLYPRGCVYMFDFLHNSWRSVNLPSVNPQLYLGPRWSDRVAVFDDILFWHYAGTIYAFDFTTKESFTPCTFEAPHLRRKREGNPRGDSYANASFLVHAGEHRLCLVWSDLVDESKFHCHTFWAQRRGPHDLHLVWEASSTFDTDCFGIQDVFAMSVEQAEEVTDFTSSMLLE